MTENRPDVADRALCGIEDVRLLVPGYSFDPDTEEVLIALINATSEYIQDERTNREIKPIATGSSERLFDLSAHHVRTRKVRIGDCNTVTTVRIYDQAGSVVETVASTNRVSLPRTRRTWEPITALWFPPSSANPVVSLTCGRVLGVTGTWGFPSVPLAIAQATAKLVLVRYLSDVAETGTELAGALEAISVGGMLKSAYEAIDGLSLPGLA